ncbi:hypothetical protein HanRHA438_Chr10g0449441 [Helianthus annuus]|nr:hypothetical protein HanRHA438_Chr10g0449441 [Helianthus annuus]
MGLFTAGPLKKEGRPKIGDHLNRNKDSIKLGEIVRSKVLRLSLLCSIMFIRFRFSLGLGLGQVGQWGRSSYK